MLVLRFLWIYIINIVIFERLCKVCNQSGRWCQLPAMSGDGIDSLVRLGGLQKYGASMGTRGIRGILSYIQTDKTQVTHKYYFRDGKNTADLQQLQNLKEVFRRKKT